MDDERRAALLKVGRCTNPECRGVHLEMVDKNGDQIAVAVMKVDLIKDFIIQVQRAAYEIVTERDDENT